MNALLLTNIYKNVLYMYFILFVVLIIAMISPFKRTFKIFRIAPSNTIPTCYMRLWALEMWLIQIKMYPMCKMHTNFKDCKKENANISLIISILITCSNKILNVLGYNDVLLKLISLVSYIN